MLHYNAIIRSPTTGQYAVMPADSATLAAVAPNAVALGAVAPTALDPTWYGAGDAGVAAIGNKAVP